MVHSPFSTMFELLLSTLAMAVTRAIPWRPESRPSVCEKPIDSSYRSPASSPPTNEVRCFNGLEVKPPMRSESVQNTFERQYLLKVSNYRTTNAGCLIDPTGWAKVTSVLTHIVRALCLSVHFTEVSIAKLSPTALVRMSNYHASD